MAGNKIKQRPKRWKRWNTRFYSNFVNRIPDETILKVLSNASNNKNIESKHIGPVRSILKRYLYDLNYDFSPLEKEISDSLASIGQGASILLGQLENANDAVKWRLAKEAYGDANFDFDPDRDPLTWDERQAPDHEDVQAPDLEDVIAALKTLSGWSAAAIEGCRSAEPGRIGENAPKHATVALARLYEDLTGKPATLSNPTDGKPDRGSFRKFANAILKLIGAKGKEPIKPYRVRKHRENEMAKMQKSESN